MVEVIYSHDKHPLLGNGHALKGHGQNHPILPNLAFKAYVVSILLVFKNIISSSIYVAQIFFSVRNLHHLRNIIKPEGLSGLTISSRKGPLKSLNGLKMSATKGSVSH